MPEDPGASSFVSARTAHVALLMAVTAVLVFLSIPRDVSDLAQIQTLLQAIAQYPSLMLLVFMLCMTAVLLIRHFELLEVGGETVGYKRPGVTITALTSDVILCLGKSDPGSTEVVQGLQMRNVHIVGPLHRIFHASPAEVTIPIRGHWDDFAALERLLLEKVMPAVSPKERLSDVAHPVELMSSVHSVARTGGASSSDITVEDAIPLAKKLSEAVRDVRGYWVTRKAVLQNQQPWTLTSSGLKERGYMQPWRFNIFQSSISAVIAWVSTILVLHFTTSEPKANFGMFFDATLTPIALALTCKVAAGAAVRREHQTRSLMRRVRVIYLYLRGAYGVLPLAASSFAYVIALEVGLLGQPYTLIVLLLCMLPVTYVEQVLIPNAVYRFLADQDIGETSLRTSWAHYQVVTLVGLALMLYAVNDIYSKIPDLFEVLRWLRDVVCPVCGRILARTI